MYGSTMSARALFATLIYESDLAEGSALDRLRDELEAACLDLAEQDAAGQAWSEANGYAGYTSYASLDDLPIRHPAFGDLKRHLDRHAAAFARELDFELDRKPRLDSLWVNVLEPGGVHTGHIHPHSILSGTVYVSVPQGAASLKVEDPRLPMMMARPTLSSAAPEERQTFVYLTPSPGKVLMWESWLRHEVPMNRSDELRISISFNYR
jgi:uncharacterized protein (TIGR02466 family)